MGSSEFPAFVQSLPQADLPFVGLRGWLLQSESGQVLFSESEVEVNVHEHSHGDQWGFVIDGKIDLTIGDQAKTFSRGDTYFIPAGTQHGARIYPGFRAVDYYADRDRYRSRSQGVWEAHAKNPRDNAGSHASARMADLRRKPTPDNGGPHPGGPAKISLNSQ